MKLVDDVRNCWRWGSTYIFAAIVAFPSIWLASTDLQALLPPRLVSAIAPVVGVLGFVIRITQRSKGDAERLSAPRNNDATDASDLDPARGIITACVVSIVFWALVLLACWVRSH